LMVKFIKDLLCRTFQHITKSIFFNIVFNGTQFQKILSFSLFHCLLYKPKNGCWLAFCQNLLSPWHSCHPHKHSRGLIFECCWCEFFPTLVLWQLVWNQKLW
jgi:hypothetical protein